VAYIMPGDVSNEALYGVLSCLRILARELYGMKDFFQEDVLDKVAFWANLSDYPSDRPENIIIEAVRCLVNMIFKSNSLRLHFLKNKLHLKISEQLKSIPHENHALLFPMLRLLYLSTRPIEKNESHREIAAVGVFQDIFGLLKFYANKEDVTSPTNISIIKECLQNMFNITIDMGPLGKGNMNYEEVTPNYEDVVTTLLQIFNIPMEIFDPTIYEVQINCINCFINIPAKFFRILVVLGNKENTMKTLIDCLEHEIRNTGDDSKNLPMILMVGQFLLSQSPEARPYFFERLFPNRDLEKEAEEDQNDNSKVNMDVLFKDTDTLGNRLVKYMTSFSQALKFSASELLFALVGEDAQKLIRLCGFGNAAGLLAMRNLFGMGKHLQEETKENDK